MKSNLIKYARLRWTMAKTARQRQSKCETNTKKMLDDDFDGQAGATLPPTVQSRA